MPAWRAKPNVYDVVFADEYRRLTVNDAIAIELGRLHDNEELAAEDFNLRYLVEVERILDGE